MVDSSAVLTAATMDKMMVAMMVVLMAGNSVIHSADSKAECLAAGKVALWAFPKVEHSELQMVGWTESHLVDWKVGPMVRSTAGSKADCWDYHSAV
jgi:hypothetical protein